MMLEEVESGSGHPTPIPQIHMNNITNSQIHMNNMNNMNNMHNNNCIPRRRDDDESDHEDEHLDEAEDAFYADELELDQTLTEMFDEVQLNDETHIATTSPPLPQVLNDSRSPIPLDSQSQSPASQPLDDTEVDYITSEPKSHDGDQDQDQPPSPFIQHTNQEEEDLVGNESTIQITVNDKFNLDHTLVEHDITGEPLDESSCSPSSITPTQRLEELNLDNASKHMFMSIPNPIGRAASDAISVPFRHQRHLSLILSPDAMDADEFSALQSKSPRSCPPSLSFPAALSTSVSSASESYFESSAYDSPTCGCRPRSATISSDDNSETVSWSKDQYISNLGEIDWKQRWAENPGMQHQMLRLHSPNPCLAKYLYRFLHPTPERKVRILCLYTNCSSDLLWLAHLGYEVIAIERDISRCFKFFSQHHEGLAGFEVAQLSDNVFKLQAKGLPIMLLSVNIKEEALEEEWINGSVDHIWDYGGFRNLDCQHRIHYVRQILGLLKPREECSNLHFSNEPSLPMSPYSNYQEKYPPPFDVPNDSSANLSFVTRSNVCLSVGELTYGGVSYEPIDWLISSCSYDPNVHKDDNTSPLTDSAMRAFWSYVGSTGDDVDDEASLPNELVFPSDPVAASSFQAIESPVTIEGGNSVLSVPGCYEFVVEFLQEEKIPVSLAHIDIRERIYGVSRM